MEEEDAAGVMTGVDGGVVDVDLLFLVGIAAGDDGDELSFDSFVSTDVD